MSIEITPDQRELVETIFESGEYASRSEVVSSALELLRQQRQLAKVVHEGVDALDRGAYVTYGPNDREKFKADIIAETRTRNMPDSDG